MPKYKYRINEKLEALPLKEYKKAIRIIPAKLEISVATFNNYRNILLEESQDIPHEKVVRLEKLLGFNCGELANFEVTEKPIHQHDEEDSSIVAKFGLSQ